MNEKGGGNTRIKYCTNQNLYLQKKTNKKICNGVMVVVMKWILEEKVKATEQSLLVQFQQWSAL